jgi:hypothetical protein
VNVPELHKLTIFICTPATSPKIYRRRIAQAAYYRLQPLSPWSTLRHNISPVGCTERARRWCPYQSIQGGSRPGLKRLLGSTFLR